MVESFTSLSNEKIKVQTVLKKKFVVNRVWMAVEEVSIVHSLKRNLPGNFRIEFYEYVLNASRVREAKFDAALSACKGG